MGIISKCAHFPEEELRGSDSLLSVSNHEAIDFLIPRSTDTCLVPSGLTCYWVCDVRQITQLFHGLNFLICQMRTMIVVIMIPPL